MNENNKVVIVAALGIIIGFGVGRFSANQQITNKTDQNMASSSAPTSDGELATTTGAMAPATRGASASATVAPASTGTGNSMGAALGTSLVSNTESEAQMSSVSSVSALNQPAGLSVTAMVSLDRFGWVAVHDDLNGRPGKILGAKHFDPTESGETHSVVIPLKRATVRGANYFVILHASAGDHTDFYVNKDLPLLGANGQPLMLMFQAQ